MKTTLHTFISILSLILVTTVANADLVSGSITSSGSIVIDNVSRAFNYGVQITSVVSGTVGTPTAVLQGSNDGTNFFNLPLKATGDATKSATLTTSGSFYLGESSVDVNYIKVQYSGVAGGGAINVQQISKTHNAIY